MNPRSRTASRLARHLQPKLGWNPEAHLHGTLYIYIYAGMYVCMYVCISMHSNIGMYICILIHTHINMHICMCIHTYVYLDRFDLNMCVCNPRFKKHSIAHWRVSNFTGQWGLDTLFDFTCLELTLILFQCFDVGWLLSRSHGGTGGLIPGARSDSLPAISPETRCCWRSMCHGRSLDSWSLDNCLSHCTRSSEYGQGSLGLTRRSIWQYMVWQMPVEIREAWIWARCGGGRMRLARSGSNDLPTWVHCVAVRGGWRMIELALARFTYCAFLLKVGPQFAHHGHQWCLGFQATAECEATSRPKTAATINQVRLTWTQKQQWSRVITGTGCQ